VGFLQVKRPYYADYDHINSIKTLKEACWESWSKKEVRMVLYYVETLYNVEYNQNFHIQQ